ncbi:MAG: helix-turn-helix domain-containing protein, partial [Candidatus Thorarchaeota archaeon]
MNKKLLSKSKSGFETKEVKIFTDPEKMKAILNSTRWEILKRLENEPKFPADLAREMNLHEQKIYYHIKQLINAGLVRVAFEKEIRGAIARYYETTEKAYAIELDEKDKGMPFKIESNVPECVIKFFEEFSENSQFNGYFVVGSPEAHGPHKTWARDGHYAIYLGMFIGQFLPPKRNLYVKLDVEVRAEKSYDQNFILIGGPAVNLVTQDINSQMKFPAFDNHIQGIAPEARFGRGITSSKSDTFYSQNNVGIIFKTRNPFNPEKTVIGFAGQGRRGTKAAILALIHKGNEILKDYSGGNF